MNNYQKGYIQIQKEKKRKELKGQLIAIAVFIGMIIAMGLAPDF